ncbi:MAG: hypothetical protein ACTSO9_08650 [Candidatus Helarchaeota archaeon]
MGFKKLENEIYKIAKKITNFIGPLLTKRVYIAIAGKNGELYHIDSDLKEYIEYIQKFMKASFSLLNINDYAIPFSSVNLFFFKPTQNIALILYTKEDTIKSGQLIGFKSQLAEYGDKLEEILKSNFKPIIEAPAFEKEPDFTEYEIATEDNKKIYDRIREVPYLLRKINPKDKFEITESVVLNLIDNELCIDEICEKANLSKERVGEILKKYREKGWVRVRIIEPEKSAGTKVNVFPKLIETVSLIIGFSDEERVVLENATGQNSIDDITKITSLNKETVVKILDKFEDKDWLDFLTDGTPDYYPKNVKKLNPMGVQLGLMSSKEFKIRELCTGDVSAKSIAKTLEMDYNELISILKEMDKKKDIKMKIKKI